MKKRITDRLSFKVFLITFVVQLLFGGLIFLVLYNATPLSWNTLRRIEMETKFAPFVEKLNNTPYLECGKVVDDFILSNDCHIVFYKEDKNEWDRFPADVTNSEYQIRVRDDVLKLINLENNKEMSLSTSGRVVFKDIIGRRDKEFTVVCLWSQKGENVMFEAIKRTLPLIVAAIVLISLICSFIYAYLFARPVRKLSVLSGKIAGMDFSVRSGTKRRDEIGDLARDLDNLSANLNETITSVNAISRILRNPPVLRALLSRAVDQESGSVISNNPKNDSANTTRIRKNTMLTTALVLRSFSADAPKAMVTNNPNPTYRIMILSP